MKKIVMSILLVVASLAWSVPAPDRFIDFNQPDGTTLTLKQIGDENIALGVTLDGYTILPTEKQMFVYAKLDNNGNLTTTDMVAHNPSNRNSAENTFLASTKKSLTYSAAQISAAKSRSKSVKVGGFPTTGTNKLIMILANYSNTTTTTTQTQFDNYMNQANYGGTGSFKDYFFTVSYNKLTVNTTVTAWVTVPNTHDYYGADAGTDHDPKAREFVRDACLAADAAGVDFAQFDNNNDGTVDGVAVVHAGTGQETSSNANDIWSHNSSLSYDFPDFAIDGKKITSYTCQPEKEGSSMNAIGVMCHEFNHNLGAYDFYDTDYTTGGSGQGTGTWDLQDQGSYNNNSRTPAYPNPYIRIQHGWSNSVTITAPDTVTISPSETSQTVYRYNTTTPNEYFLVENRQKTGFDAYIPGAGMMIYHADGNYMDAHPHDFNSTTAHQGFHPEIATGSTVSSAACAWPGTGAKTQFTDITTPNSKSWAGAFTNKPVKSIALNATTKDVTFYFNTDPIIPPPTAFAATFDKYKVNMNWSAPTLKQDLAGYNVYMDGVKLNTTVLPLTQTSINTRLFEAGNHTFHATATYANPTAESVTSNVVTINLDSATVGNHWIPQNSSFTVASRGIRDIFPLSATTAWVTNYDGSGTSANVQEYAITTNGGSTWIPKTITFTGSTNYGIGNISAFDATNAYAAIYNQTAAVAANGIYKTVDGTNWTKTTSASQFTTTTSFPNLVHMFSAKDGYAQGDPAGGYFEIYTTSDSARTWTRVPKVDVGNYTPASGEYGTVNVCDAIADTAWFATNKGRIFKSIDKGKTWTYKPYATSGTLQGIVRIFFCDSKIGFVVTSNGNTTTPVYTIYKSVDGGSVWAKVTPKGLANSIHDIMPVPGVSNYPGALIAVSANETSKGSFVSFDYGATWSVIDKNNTQYTSVSFLDANTGWSGTFNGTDPSVGGMFKFNSHNGDFWGTNSINDESGSKPVVAKLHQNYPNPFNPVTTISFDLVKDAKVQLTVYNAKGEMVKSLVNSNLTNGAHKFNFDGSSLNSGVYFYQLNVNGSIMNNKMVLVK